MAYSQAFDDATEMDSETSTSVSRIAGWMGAICSLALVVGLGLWVFDLATRDVTGVPVIVAMQGPSRAAPEDPGGFEALHQGLAVNRIASEDNSVPLAERLVLAPEAETLKEADVPMKADAPVDRDAALRSAVNGALTEVLQQAVQDPEPGLDSELSATPPATPRPVMRPKLDLATRALSTTELSVVTELELDVTPATVPAGAQLVQVGALTSHDEAVSEWDRLDIKFEGYFFDKQRVIEKAEVGGKTFYRLRVMGFGDRNEARNFCAILVAENSDCIPVLTR